MKEISEMELFVKVVEEGSFSSTARYFGVTPSSISKQVSQLETHLCVRLFQRTTRKQKLTEAGVIYYQHSKRIIGDILEAKLAVSQLSNTPSGNLHISAEVDFALVFIEPILPEFLQLYPDINVRITMSAGLADIFEGGIDLALRMGHLEDSSMIARKLMTSHSVICASPQYLKKFGVPQTPEDLSKHNCISFKTQFGDVIWNFEIAGDINSIPIKCRTNVNSLSFLRRLVMANTGIAMIPSWMISEQLNLGQLIPILESYPMLPSSTPIHAVYAHNRHLAPKVRVFVDFMVDKLRSK
jgi:DNA-binding transcriptional LysR family regulator